jgi:hypothetical protein
VAISGRFTPEGVVLRPVHRVRARLPADDPYVDRHLKVRFADGRERIAPIRADEIADLPAPEYSFATLIEDWGPIDSIEVLVNGAPVLARRAVMPVEAAPKATLVRLNENELLIGWDPARYPYLAVAHLGGDERTTLALALGGGSARVRLDGLGAGKIELSLSNGVDAAPLVLPLPAP